MSQMSLKPNHHQYVTPNLKLNMILTSLHITHTDSDVDEDIDDDLTDDQGEKTLGNDIVESSIPIFPGVTPVITEITNIPHKDSSDSSRSHHCDYGVC